MEERRLLEHIAPDEFHILHYGAVAELKKNIHSLCAGNRDRGI